MSKVWDAVFLLCGLVLVLGLGCGKGESTWNVLIITLDTFRADRVGCYGKENAETRNLDGLAADGVRCENAIAHQPLTLPSHTSMLTGLLPTEHLVRYNDSYTLADELTTVAEAALENGYRTAAFVGSMALSSRFGLDQGFEVYNQDFTASSVPDSERSRYVERRAADVNRAAFEWLEKHGREPFLVWIHYWDAHTPYIPPEPFLSGFAEDPYQGEVAYVDSCLGQLLAKLKRLDILDRTAVVVAGDHGEGLGDHREWTHGVFLYESTLKVPLIVRAPGRVRRGLVIEQPVGLSDVAPTVLDLADIPIPGQMTGASLLERLHPGAEEEEPDPVYIESFDARLVFGWSALRGLRTERWKYISAPTPELYDLKTDPGETRNVFDEQSEVAGRLQRELDRVTAADPGPWAPSARAEPDPETRAQLEALGYMAASAPPSASEEGKPRPDPKDMYEVLDLLDTTKDLLRQGRSQEAVARLEAARAKDPENPEIKKQLLVAYRNLGDHERAGKLTEAVLDAPVSLPSDYEQLGETYRSLGEWEKAAENFRMATLYFPRDAQLHLDLAQCLARMGDWGAVVSALERAAELEPERIDLQTRLGEGLAGKGDWEAAATQFRGVLESDPGNPAALLGLGTHHYRKREYGEAVRLLELAAQSAPDSVPILEKLALSLEANGDTERAGEIRARLQSAVSNQPSAVSGH